MKGIAQMERDNNLREWRLANGMTLKELARRTGLDYRYLSQLERGLRKGTPNTWIKLRKSCRCLLKLSFLMNLRKPERSIHVLGKYIA
ncbi:helix-turn-helix domain-containing protein [Desulfitobacterium hafniense]